MKAFARESEIEVVPAIDRDTLGTPGAPDIFATILEKIDKSDAFVADVSLVAGNAEAPIPNPNVLFEAGYALKSLGEKKLVFVLNESFGSVSDLPFDLRGRRIATYRYSGGDEPPGEARSKLKAVFLEALESIANYEKVAKNYSEFSEFGTALYSRLNRTRVLGEEAKERSFGRWRDEISDSYRGAAREVRNWVSEPAARALEVEDDLEILAGRLDVVSEHVHVAGGHRSFVEKVDRVIGQAIELQKRLLTKGPLTKEAKAGLRRSMEGCLARAKAWLQRLPESRISTQLFEEFLADISEIGNELIQDTYYPLDWLPQDPSSRLRELGHWLHLVELNTSRRSFRRREDFIDLVRDKVAELESTLGSAGLM